jgi:hypothetical protein
MSLAVAIRGKRIRLAVVALLSGLSCLPFLRSIFWLADEGVLLQGAERLLRGEKLYHDFFEILPPGGFLLTAGWFELTNVSFSSARVLATFTFIGIACVLYSVTLLVSCNTLASTATVVVFVARASAVGLTTIRRAELTDSETSMTAANDLAVRRALESAGVEFIDENGGGPGVRHRKPAKEKPRK